MTAVPVIDLGAARRGRHAERRRLAEAIDAACRETGFFAITGHGVAPALVDDLRRCAHAFFALPLA
jgi:isopenicillin N synthase-like dioxygenase